MGLIRIFEDLDAVFVTHSWLGFQKATKKYSKRAKNPILGLVLTGPNTQYRVYK